MAAWREGVIVEEDQMVLADLRSEARVGWRQPYYRVGGVLEWDQDCDLRSCCVLEKVSSRNGFNLALGREVDGMVLTLVPLDWLAALQSCKAEGGDFKESSRPDFLSRALSRLVACPRCLPGRRVRKRD